MMHSENMAGSYTRKEFGASSEEQAFLVKENGTSKIKINAPVKLTPCLEGTDMDGLNYRRSKMEPFTLEIKPPKDRLNIVYLIMLLHGVGALMPWNMMITAKDYFDYKLSAKDDDVTSDYNKNFLAYIGFAAQIPNVAFSWLNLFLPLRGNLTARIVWGIFFEGIIFVLTVVLAMIDSTKWTALFFWITMTSVVVLNISGGIYQNSVFGMAAKLPVKYTGAVVLGSNISGTFTATVSLLAVLFEPHPRTAAIYYFITALFVLLACFDTYFALHINRFYRYYNQQHQEEVDRKQQEAGRFHSTKTPYWKVFKQCWVQCFNVWFTLFITLAVFPAVQSDIKPSDPDFIFNITVKSSQSLSDSEPEGTQLYPYIMCFLVFNITATIGSWMGMKIRWPSRKYLIIMVLLRAAYVPLFLYCKYEPKFADRTLPVLIQNDWVFLGLGITLGLTSGHFSSLAMQYCPSVVERQYSATAGMFGAAFLVTGVLSGVTFSMLMPTIVESFSINLWEVARDAINML